MTHPIESARARLTPILVTALVAALSGCDKTADAGTTPPSSASAKPTASVEAAAAARPSASAAAPEVASAGVPADWVDIDLAPAGKFWTDYTMKAPPSAKVKKGTPDPTIDAGDQSITLSVTRTKKSTAGLDTARAYGVSWKPLTDTPELFEYETSGEQNGEKFVRYNFDSFVKVGEKTIGCGATNNQKVREALAPLIAACRTLRKK